MAFTYANAADVIGSPSGNVLTGNNRDNHFTLAGRASLPAAALKPIALAARQLAPTSSTTAPKAPSTDILDFQQLGASVNLNLDPPIPVLDTANFADGAVTFSSLAVRGVVGSPFNDIILGNPAPGAPSVSIYGGGGRDSLVAGSGDDLLQADVPQVVLLDFDTWTALGAANHVYTPGERDAIQQRLEDVFAAFNSSSQYGAMGLIFTQDPATALALARPTGGEYYTIFFNEPPVGGLADEVNFRHVDRGGSASVNASLILGFPGQPAPTSANFIAESANLAAHELAHLYGGLRHADSFGPIGYGPYEVFAKGQQISGVNPNLFVPGFQEPAGLSPVPVAYSPDGGATQIAATAFGAETPLHVMASPRAVGISRFDTLNNIYFGEREAIRLAFDDSGMTVPEQSAPHQSFAGAEALGLLPGLAVPNTLLPGSLNYGATFAVTALDVVGHISIDPNTQRSEDDFYSFLGHKDQLMEFEVDSSVLSRIAHPIDSMLEIYDASGNLIAFNDDEFESRDSRIFDLKLPADGIYYAVVDTYTPDAAHDTATGDYEFFMYSFATGSTSLRRRQHLGRGQRSRHANWQQRQRPVHLRRRRQGSATVMGGNGADLVDETPARRHCHDRAADAAQYYRR